MTGPAGRARCTRAADEVIHDLDDSSQLPCLEERGVQLFRGWGRLAGERRVPVDEEPLVAVTGLRWSVWTTKRAVGHGESFRMGYSPVTITLTRPRRACGHVAFTLATFASGSSMLLNDRCLSHQT